MQARSRLAVPLDRRDVRSRTRADAGLLPIICRNDLGLTYRGHPDTKRRPSIISMGSFRVVGSALSANEQPRSEQA